MKIKITDILKIVMLLVFFIFIGEAQLTGMMTNKKTDNQQSQPKKEEYQGKGTRAYNKAHPIQPKAKSQQIIRRSIPSETAPLNPEPIPPAPVKTQQQQIEENQQQMLEQLLLQKNPNNQSE